MTEQFPARLAAAVAQLAAHGGDVRRFYVTEAGIATDNGRPLTDNYGWPRNLTYGQAASIVSRTIEELAASGRVAQLIYFQSSDRRATGTRSGRESYFGALQADGATPKGALTRTVAALLARYR